MRCNRLMRLGLSNRERSSPSIHSRTMTRISSMAAIYAAALSTIWIIFLGYSQMFILGVILTLLVFFRHAANIRRLRSGTEPKIGQS